MFYIHAWLLWLKCYLQQIIMDSELHLEPKTFHDENLHKYYVRLRMLNDFDSSECHLRISVICFLCLFLIKVTCNFFISSFSNLGKALMISVLQIGFNLIT